MIHKTADGKPVSFADFPKEKFPIRMYAFDGDGELVWTRTIDPYVVTEIPGTGPRSVRYVVSIFGDGTAICLDDPTFGGSLPDPVH